MNDDIFTMNDQHVSLQKQPKNVFKFTHMLKFDPQ